MNSTEYKPLRFASSPTSMVHPMCNSRSSKRRRKSFNRYPNKESVKGEEHWTKVFQTNEFSNFTARRCSCKNQLPQKQFRNRRKIGSRSSFFSLIHRFCDWINGRVNENDNDSELIPQLTKSGSDSGCETDIPPNSHPVLIRTQKIHVEQIHVTEADDPNYVFIRNSQSAETSPSSRHGRLSSTNSFINEVFNDDNKSVHNFLSVNFGESGSRQSLTVTRSAPSRSQRASRVTHSDGCDIRPYHTWPLRRKILQQREEEKRTVFDDTEPRILRNPSAEDVSNLKEFSIPYDDLEFSTCFRTGRERVIYRGRWHGDVNIHYFGNYKALDFWHLVTKMQKVRHENVALFMGTCTDFNRYAIIESIQDGVSLYEHIHIQKEVASMQSKIQLLRQISHGISYLHAKGIVVKTLSTRNIFLCPKARVSVMDYGIVEPQHDREGLASLPRGYLTYIAPEILRTIVIDPPTIYMRADYTKESDVFAFGTIIYEMIKWQYPFYGHTPESIIWKICNNIYLETDKIKNAKAMRRLKDMCWEFDPTLRPNFSNISRDLNRTVSLSKRHSVSEPDILSKTGSNASFC